jgi:NDP-sugar pyrophosphorylase family protein
MKSVILAGGKGTRLLPYTTVLPKPLMPVGPMPILEIVLRQQYHHGVREVTLACGHLAELIEAFLFHHALSKLMKISYFVETIPLGTAGALRAIPGLDETFLVMNGDILTTIDYAKLIQSHRKSGAALTIAVTQKKIRIELGVLVIDDRKQVVGYDEKPVKQFPASTGIYVYEPRVLQHIEPGETLDFPTLVLRLIAAGETVAAYPTDEFWLDIGNKDDFERAGEEFENRRMELHVDADLSAANA